MRKIFLFIFAFSTVASIVMFASINHFTEKLHGSLSGGGGNGNPGLFPILFLYPFFFFFLYGMVKIAYNFLYSKFETRLFKYVMLLSFLLVSIISAMTINKANSLRTSIMKINQSFSDSAPIPLLNTFSNNIFFNAFTFTLVVLVCILIAGILVWRKKLKIV